MSDKEQEVEAAEVGDEALEEVSGGYGEGSGGASMEINVPGNTPATSSVNYP